MSGTGKASVVSGMKFVADCLGLEDQIRHSDLVITGEGSFDLQTLEGKAVSQIIKMCRKLGKPVVVVCGVNAISQDDASDITVIDFTSRFGLTASKSEAAECLRKVCETEIYDLIR